MHMNLCTCVYESCVYECTTIYMNICIYLYIYTYACMYIYQYMYRRHTYKHIYAYTYKCIKLAYIHT